MKKVTCVFWEFPAKFKITKQFASKEEAKAWIKDRATVTSIRQHRDDYIEFNCTGLKQEDQ